MTRIQHFCTHDGPGIRTTVFLKGCTLRCKWCCNPESIAPGEELAYDSKLCIGAETCGYCLPACDTGALQAGAGGRIAIDWNRCTDCVRCVSRCPSRALYQIGQRMSVPEVLAEVEQDAPFYLESGGGLTLSGGECLLQPDFCLAVVREARARGIDTAVETAGNVPWRSMEKVLPYVNTVLHDYKVDDPQAHRKWTGAGNARILDNYRRAYERFPDIRFIARIPVVRPVSDAGTLIERVRELTRPYANVVEIELLPYHSYGEGKYELIGRRAQGGFAPPSGELLDRLRAKAGA